MSEKLIKNLGAVILERQTQASLATAGVNSIFESELAAMGLRNLPAENQAYSRACRFGGEEWDKKIRGIRNTGTIIDHPHFHLRTLHQPTNLHAAVSFQRRVGRIAN